MYHMMDFKYYNQDCVVEVYSGTLLHDVVLKPEKHPLHWISAKEDFFDPAKYAGEGNIGHMVLQVEEYGKGVLENQER